MKSKKREMKKICIQKKVFKTLFLLAFGAVACQNDDYKDPRKVRDPAKEILQETEKRQAVFSGKWNVSEQSDSFTTVKTGKQIRVKMWRQSIVEYRNGGDFTRSQTIKVKDNASNTILETAGIFGGKWKFDSIGKWQEMIESCDLRDIYSEFGDKQKSDCTKIEKGKFLSVANVNFAAFNAKQISFQAQDPNGLKFSTTMKKME